MILAAMLFHGLWYATTDVAGLEDVRGEWTPMPIGARVLYLPKADRQKTTRFDGYTRFGIHMEYAHSLRPRRGYVILDERDLLVNGKPRFVIAKQVRLAGIDNTPECHCVGRRVWIASCERVERVNLCRQQQPVPCPHARHHARAL